LFVISDVGPRQDARFDWPGLAGREMKTASHFHLPSTLPEMPGLRLFHSLRLLRCHSSACASHADRCAGV